MLQEVVQDKLAQIFKLPQYDDFGLLLWTLIVWLAVHTIQIPRGPMKRRTKTHKDTGQLSSSR
jgi:hypothetical protein